MMPSALSITASEVAQKILLFGGQIHREFYRKRLMKIQTDAIVREPDTETGSDSLLSEYPPLNKWL